MTDVQTVACQQCGSPFVPIDASEICPDCEDDREDREFMEDWDAALADACVLGKDCLHHDPIHLSYECYSAADAEAAMADQETT